MKQLTVHELEELVRSGNFREVQRHLSQLNLKGLPREEALPIANIARRVHQNRLALKILNPIVRSTNSLDSPASPAEMIEYAESLRRVGAVTEAIRIFQSIDRTMYPQTGFHLALCYFAQWKTKPIVPLLREYIQTFQAPSYALCVARVNLAAALISEEELDEAESLLRELQTETRKADYKLLYGNTLELNSQIEILHRKNWQKASTILDEAESVLSQTVNSVDRLFIQKWRAVMDSFQAGKATESLLRVRAQALEMCHWETVRSCDFFRAKINRDLQGLIYLYFGTPFNSFREMILKEPDVAINLPSSYLWQSSSFKTERIFDVGNASGDDGYLSLPPGQALHQLLILLTRDFYKPQPMVSLFAEIFPDEYFNPTSSANRIHQLTKRLREWLLENKIPVELKENGGSYSLHIVGSFAFQVPNETLPMGTEELELRLLKLSLPQTFSAKDAQTPLKASPAKVQRLLQWGVKNQKVAVVGSGPKTRYKMVG